MTTVDSYPENCPHGDGEAAGAGRRRRQTLSRWNLAATLLTERQGATAGRPGRGPQTAVLLPHRHEASRAAEVPGIVEESGGRARRRQHSPGRRRPRRVGRSSRHRPRGHRAGDRRHQHRRPLAGRRRACAGGARECRCSSSAWAATSRVRELKLSDLLVDNVVFVNDLVHFRFRLAGTGLAGKKAAVVLRQEGKAECWLAAKWPSAPTANRRRCG